VGRGVVLSTMSTLERGPSRHVPSQRRKEIFVISEDLENPADDRQKVPRSHRLIAEKIGGEEG